MTEAVRESVRMFLLQDVLTKGTLNAPESARIYHGIGPEATRRFAYRENKAYIRPWPRYA